MGRESCNGFRSLTSAVSRSLHISTEYPTEANPSDKCGIRFGLGDCFIVGEQSGFRKAIRCNTLLHFTPNVVNGHHGLLCNAFFQ